MIAALNWVHEAFEEGPLNIAEVTKKGFIRNALPLTIFQILKVTQRPFPSKVEMGYNF